MVTPLPASPSYLQRPIIPVEDPGKGPGPLFLDQTAAEGSETTFGGRGGGGGGGPGGDGW